MKELQRMERLEIFDIMVFHSQHGFTWHYLAKEMPNLSSYPMELAKDFCGELLGKKHEFMEHVQDDMARECRHGFGHGVFYVKALQQLGVSGKSYSASQQFRPGAGFLLKESLLCESYQICDGSPKIDTRPTTCHWIMRIGRSRCVSHTAGS